MLQQTNIKMLIEAIKEEIPCRNNWQKTNRSFENLFESMDEVIQFMEQMKLFVAELYEDWEAHPEHCKATLAAFNECVQALKAEQAKHI